MYGMVKTTLYLPEDLKLALRQMAVAEGRAEAEIIRDAIRSVVARRRRLRPRVPLVPTGLGDPLAAERVDELLAEFGSP